MLKPKLIQEGDLRILMLPTWVEDQIAEFRRILWKLRNLPTYQSHCDQGERENVLFDPGNTGVCLGFDFHVHADQLFLVEVNTNAFGMFMVPQSMDVKDHILHMFQNEWETFGQSNRPQFIAIVEKHPKMQKAYKELCAYRDLFLSAGIHSDILEPHMIQKDPKGFLVYQDQKIDMIYLRWTDFVLSEPDAVSFLEAYLAKKVCMTPSPREHHLIANKKRLAIFCQAALLQKFGLTLEEARFLSQLVPYTEVLSDKPLGYWMDIRKDYVFKPAAKFASRGVYLGSTISRNKFEKLYLEDRVAQLNVIPGEVVDSQSNKKLKFDIRAFAYQSENLGYLGRVYEGMVTNFRSPEAGLVQLKFA